MKVTNSFVSIVAPLYNDADIVTSFVEDVLSVLSVSFASYELVLVDDGSDDETANVVTELLQVVEHVRLVRLSRPFGQEIAIAAGLDSVIGDYVVVMLPDSDPPQLIPHMVEQSIQGSGIVFGIRKERSAESRLQRSGVHLFYWYCNRVLKLSIPPNTTHFRVLSRQAVNAVTQIKDRMRYLHTLGAYAGYSEQSFYYTPIQRRQQPRTKSLWEAANLAINIIVANSTQPLRMVSALGFMLSVLNVLYMAYIVLIYLMKERVAEGWVTQSMQNAVMFFSLFLILAVLCEYVGRILSETRERPLYYVRNEYNSSALIMPQTHKNVVMDSVEEVQKW